MKLANTLLALAPGQLPLVKLADFGFSKDTGQHSAPASQVGRRRLQPPAGLPACQHAHTQSHSHIVTQSHSHTVTRSHSHTITLAHTPQVGTALFVAPEVMHNFSGAPYDGAAVDVWAAGIVLFVLLFGRHPFLRPADAALPEQQQMLALFTRTAASQFCLLPEEAGAISPACADLLGHMLQTNPTAR